MTPADRKLLIRIANRMEKYALVAFSGARLGNEDEARRTRDRELGDVRDLKDLVKRDGREE